MLQHSANRYFAFIAERFPVMCASDEFHFLPRAEQASKYYDRIDNLEAGLIKNTIDELKQFRNEFLMLRKKSDITFEIKIDLDLLIANISGILIEIESKESFQNNPILYLKIAFIGLDHALHRPAESVKEVVERTSRRLEAIPRLLNQGVVNLHVIPESLYEHAISMTADCKEYMESTVASFFQKTNPGTFFEQGMKNTLEALNSYKYFLLSKSPLPDSMFSSKTIGESIKKHFMYDRSLDDIFEIAVHEWNTNLKNLENTGKKINPKTSWKELYENTTPSDMKNISIIMRYRREAESINNFFEKKGLVKKSLISNLVIAETPCYLRAIRGSASFVASLTSEKNEKDFFYISVNRFNDNKEVAKSLERRLHREFKFLTAHETFPGHLLLDSVRRNLKNPIRRQIESPFFYEGWATYAESLLADYGYVIHPADLIVDFRRRLWRAARCQIDSGISAGKLDMEGAVRLLTRTGFSREEAIMQINRFSLNPGYQLCYCLGSYEIRKLKDKYIPRFGENKFYDFLLQGGELPFHLIKKRMENYLNLQARSRN